MLDAPNYSLHDLIARFGGELVGDGGTRVARVASLANARQGDLTFLSDSRHSALVGKTRASAVLLGPQARDLTDLPRIITDNPYAYFARVQALLNPRAAARPGIDASAVVCTSASIPASASIGANAVVGEAVKLGEGVVIGPGCVLGDRAEIGDGSLLHANVTIYHDCVVGRHCVLHSGAVIGADGFGFAEDQGRWIKIPQVGRTVLGDDVEIGANTTVDRGALDDTVIENGAKIDNLVQVGHNCRIGEHTAIAGCTGIAGSANIGRRCKVGGAAMIGGHLDIADDTTVSGCTVINKSVHVGGVYTSILPFMPHRDWVKNAPHIRHLEKLAGRIKQLEAELAELKGKQK